MLRASAVRRFRSSRRRNPSASMTSEASVRSSGAEPRGPGIEIGKGCMRGFGAELAHSNEARERRSKLRRCKVTDEQGTRVRSQERIGIRRERVLDEDRDKKAGVEVKAHRQSSSRIRETSVPASIEETDPLDAVRGQPVAIGRESGRAASEMPDGPVRSLSMSARSSRPIRSCSASGSRRSRPERAQASSSCRYSNTRHARSESLNLPAGNPARQRLAATPEREILKALFGLRCPDQIRSIIERFRRETPVISQAEIHARVRLKTVGSV